MTNLSVFILAAGLGERLRPVTDHIPKPLLPVMGKPVFESVLEKLSALPITSIGVNLHYKKEAVEKWINRSAFSSKIVLFPEDPVLGTGGALKNAERFLKDSDFLVHNADILSDINIERLIQFHRESGNLATLSVHAYPKFNNLVVDHTGQLMEIGAMCSLCRKPGLRLLAFTGIAVYAPEFLKILPGGASSVVHSWTKAISSGQKIGTYDVTGCYWTDIGTPASYAKAVIDELKNKGETVYIHPSVESCRNADINGYVAIERKSFLDSGVSLRNCIVLPGTEIKKETMNNASPECFLTLFWGKGPGNTTHTSRTDAERTSFENCILGPDFTIALMESDLFDISVDNFVQIGTGGSDRKYFRGRKNGSPAVLMQCPENDTDYDRHIEYTQFLKNYSIPVPEIIDVEPDRKRAFFEDIGDLSLYSWLKCPREEDDLEEMYRKVIDILVLLHSSATEHISECPSLQKRIFDYEHLKWETGYFIERFLNGIPGIKIDNIPSLNDEFHKLASKADSFHKTIVHRDFQSQNIMVTKGGIPRLLDYQGARIGPPAYDVVSILWDPYYRLDGSIRERLLNYYMGRMSAVAGWFSKQDFHKTILPCRLQRHMQALGAYGFLSSAKGKKYFLKYIPEGLRLLREDLHETGQEYPALNSLIHKL